MRSTCVALCFFAVYLSSSTYATRFVRRDGSISFPNAALESADQNSANNYPTESSSDKKTDKTDDPKPKWGSGFSPAPPEVTKDQGSDQPLNNYPTGPSTNDTGKKDQAWGPPTSYPSDGSNTKKEQPKKEQPKKDLWSSQPTDNKTDGKAWPTPKDNSTSPQPVGPKPGKGAGSWTPPGSSNGTGMPSTQQCEEYSDVKTKHASCDSNPAIVCTGGCTGGRVAQNCQLNATSPNTTQTCSLGFSKDTAASYICLTPAGAYSCAGPSSGVATCSGCVAASSVNNTSGPDSGYPGAGSSNETNPGGSSGGGDTSAATFISPLSAALVTVLSAIGGTVLL